MTQWNQRSSLGQTHRKVHRPTLILSRHGAKILALVPLAFLIWMVVQYAVAVPFWDQWELVPLLEKTYHGELTFHDLWAQHNEHRIFFPKIIMLVLARLTGWNIHFELAVNIVLALGIFGVLVRQVKITGRKTGMSGLFWRSPPSRSLSSRSASLKIGSGLADRDVSQSARGGGQHFPAG